MSFYLKVLLDLLVLKPKKLTVKATEASFSVMRASRSKFIYRLGMPTVSIFIILSLSCTTNNFGNPFAEAQSSITTVQEEEQNADEAIQTFQIDGAIGSLVTDLLNPTMRENVSDSLPIYVLVGNWSMGVMNGEVNYLQVDFVMALENGMQMQVYSIENLENIVIPSPAQDAGLTPDQEISSNLVLALQTIIAFRYLGMSTY